MMQNEKIKMTLGKKIKLARQNAGLSQKQLADKLFVSRQAITKWESDKGIPDIENLKRLSNLFNISLDALLGNKEHLDLSVIKENIHLDDYTYIRKFNGRWNKKAGQKDMAVLDKFPDCEIHALLGRQILRKDEKITGNAVGFLTNAPFGIPEFLNGIKNADKEFLPGKSV